MKRKFKFVDRMNLLQYLPITGKFDEMILCKSIRSKIEITSEDVNKYGITSEGGLTFVPDVHVHKEFEIEFNDRENHLLETHLKKLKNEGKDLTENFVDLYFLFFPEG